MNRCKYQQDLKDLINTIDIFNNNQIILHESQLLASNNDNKSDSNPDSLKLLNFTSHSDVIGTYQTIDSVNHIKSVDLNCKSSCSLLTSDEYDEINDNIEYYNNIIINKNTIIDSGKRLLSANNASNDKKSSYQQAIENIIKQLS